MGLRLFELLKNAFSTPAPESGARSLTNRRLTLEPVGSEDRGATPAAATGSLPVADRADDSWRALAAAADRYEAEGRMLSAIATYGAMLTLRGDDPELLERIDDVAGGSALVPEEEFNTEGPVTASPCRRRKAPLFSEFTAEELLDVLKVLAVRDLAAGEELFRQGEPCSTLHLVVSGEIALTRRAGGLGDGSAETGRVRCGEIVGAMSRVAVDTRHESALATRSSRVLTLDGARLEEVISRHPRVWKVIDEYQTASFAGALSRA